jgi:hypothetical protein
MENDTMNLAEAGHLVERARGGDTNAQDILYRIAQEAQGGSDSAGQDLAFINKYVALNPVALPGTLDASVPPYGNDDLAASAIPKSVVFPEDSELLERSLQARIRIARDAAVLCAPGLRIEQYAEARREIKAAWKALAGRDVITGTKLRLMLEVDHVATEPDKMGAKAGRAVVARLPMDMAKTFDAHCDVLGTIVEAWRVRKPGRGHKPGKFTACADLWRTATGEVTKAGSWEALWKSRGLLNP